MRDVTATLTYLEVERNRTEGLDPGTLLLLLLLEEKVFQLLRKRHPVSLGTGLFAVCSDNCWLLPP